MCVSLIINLDNSIIKLDLFDYKSFFEFLCELTSFALIVAVLIIVSN